MKGAAERPGGAGREAGPGPGREPESASFAVVRVGRRGRRQARDPEPGESPLLARALAEGATFAPRRIAPGRRPPWLIATVAVAGLASLVALAGVGGAGADSARTTASSSPTATENLAIAQPAAPVAVRPPGFGRVEAGLGVAPVMLDLPAGADARITGAALTVDGELEVRASTLRIALEVDRLHRLEAVTLDATDPDGGLRPDRTLRFHAELALPSPRPTGRLWLVITAFDRAGHPIGILRRAVEIAGLVPT